MKSQLRVARPVTDIERSVKQYTDGRGLKLLGSFRDHEGFDGAMIGTEGMDYHLEFTVCEDHPQTPRTTPEDLLVFYVPETQQWERACASMRAAGFKEVRPFNPYWGKNGSTFQDHDGYLVVLHRASWSTGESAP